MRDSHKANIRQRTLDPSTTTKNLKTLDLTKRGEKNKNIFERLSSKSRFQVVVVA